MKESRERTMKGPVIVAHVLVGDPLQILLVISFEWLLTNNRLSMV